MRCELLLLAGAATLWAAASTACSSPEVPAAELDPTLSGGAAGYTGVVLGGTPGIPGGCGRTVVPVSVNRPTLYFVLDRSGSMRDPFQGELSGNRWDAARGSVTAILRNVGHRVRYGVAIFPLGDDFCGDGHEVFPTQDGDPASYGQADQSGPVLRKLVARLASYQPSGGTPTSATIRKVGKTLTALPGKKALILATDGAPNCNAGLRCTSDNCLADLGGGVTVDGAVCGTDFSCCDPAHVTDGPEACLDATATTGAIGVLRSMGIETYVIGLAGSTDDEALFRRTLDSLAVAGGTARPATPRYWSAASTVALSAALAEIAGKVTATCDIELNAKPPDPTLVNVYFDREPVAANTSDGWVWLSATSIQLRGAACEKLKSGAATELLVAAGCPTILR